MSIERRNLLKINCVLSVAFVLLNHSLNQTFAAGVKNLSECSTSQLSDKIESPIAFAIFMAQNARDHDLIWQISYSLAKSQEFDRAISLAETLKEPDDRGNSIASIAYLLAKDGQFDRAMNLAEKIQSASYQDDAFSGIIRELLKSQKFDDALRVCQRIQSESNRESRLLEIAKSLAEHGHVEKARNNILSITSPQTQASGLYEIADIYLRNDDFDNALEVISWIQELLPPSNHQDVRAVNTAEYARFIYKTSKELAKSGKVEEAITLIKAISNRDKQSAGHHILADELQSLGHHESALNLLQDATKLANTIEWPATRSSRLRLINQVYNKLIHSFILAGRLDRALKIADDVSDVSMRSRLRDQISYFLTDVGEWEQALELLRNYKEDSHERSIAFRKLSDYAVKQKRYSQALLISDRIESDYFNARAKVSIARRMLEKKDKQREEIESVIEQALNHAELIDVERNRNELFARIVYVYANLERFEFALNLTSQISSHHDREEATQAICYSLADVGKISQAENLCDSISKKWFRDQTRLYFVSVLTDEQELDKALTISRKVRDAGSESGQLAKLYQKLVEAKRLNDALEVALRLDQKNYYLDAFFNELSSSFLSKGDVKKAIEVLKLCEKIEPINIVHRLELQDEILKKLIQTNQVDQALSFLKSIPPRSNEFEARIAISRAQFDSGQICLGLEMVEQILLEVNQLENKSKQRKKLLTVTNLLISTEQYDRALELAGDLPTKKRRAKRLLQSASVLVFEPHDEDSETQFMALWLSAFKKEFTPEESQVAEKIVRFVSGR